jgi:hypothetical protein
MDGPVMRIRVAAKCTEIDPTLDPVYKIMRLTRAVGSEYNCDDIPGVDIALTMGAAAVDDLARIGGHFILDIKITRIG